MKRHSIKRKKGLKLTLVGVFLGISLGLAILAIEALVVGELEELLNDEARKACNCTFEAESIEVSLLRLRGHAKNARILRKGEPKLIFKEVDATFSLSRLSEKQIVLSDLHLKDGVAYNVDEDSVTFQFIDSISTAPPPDVARQDRWKLYLEQLRVSSSRFTQDFPGTYITGRYIAMTMNRNANDDFELKPTIGDLRLTLKRTGNRANEKTIQLGKVTTQLTLEDSQALFKKLRLNEGKTNILIDALSNTDNANALSGDMNFVVDTFLLQLGDFINTTLAGNASLSGSLGNPGASGTFSLEKDGSVPFTIAGIPLFYLSALEGNFDYDLNHGAHKLIVDTLKGNGDAVSVRLTKPLTLDDTTIAATFSLSIGSFTSEGITIEDINATAILEDTLEDIQFTVQGSAQRTQIGNFFLPELRFKINNKPTLSFNITHSSAEAGSINVMGTLKEQGSQVVLRDGKITLKNLSLFQKLNPGEANKPGVLKRLLLSGSTSLAGPLSLYELAGTGSLTVTSRHFAGEAALTGNVEIGNGALVVKAFNGSKSLDGQLSLDFREEIGEVLLLLEDFRPAEYYPDASCIKASAKAQYSFPLDDPQNGEGNVALNSVSLGCVPYDVQLQSPASIPVQDGTATLTGVSLTSGTTDFSIDGTVSFDRLNLKANGSLILNALLGFIPALDDLSGNLDASIAIEGTLTAPIINGYATVMNGEFASEASDLIAENLHGTLSLKDSTVAIDYLTGTVNGGTIAIRGSANILDLSTAKATIDIVGMAIHSVDDISVTTSSSLQISQGEELPKIEGEIRIDTLEARKDINLSSLVKALVKAPTTATVANPLRKLPAIELALHIVAPRNIFLYSNFLTAEFAADIAVNGSLNDPVITGELTTHAGWLGLKNRRFEITSGVVSFNKDPTNPEIEIIGESSIFGKTGEFVTIILEATGTLATPEIELTSDSGLTQNQILNMLTSEVRDVSNTKVNTIGERDGGDGLSLVEERPGSELRNVLHRLTSIDDLAVEPALNTRTAAIEPVLTATKRITDDLAIIGDTFLGPEASSRLRLRYDLTPFLNIAGTFDSINTEQNSSLGVDLTYTVFARKVPFIEYNFSGNSAFSTLDILRGVRLNVDSRVTPGELARITSSIERFYKHNGYLHALTVLNCESHEGYCRTLSATIFEGPPTLIESRKVSGDPLPPEIPERRLPDIASSQPATEAIREYHQQTLIELLRSEGYLSSRVSGYYQEMTEHSAQLILDLSVGNQDSFIFSGNTVFSPEDFLQTINLFNRKQPFGRNTIKILVENMERMYREAGYLYASIDYEKSVDPESKKTTYRVMIREEIPVHIESIRFLGNNAIDEAELKQLFKEVLPEQYPTVFQPRTLVAERIEEACNYIKTLYQIEGYPEVAVSYAVRPGSGEQEVALEYLVNEGAPLLLSKLHLEDFPDDITPPTKPDGVLSVPRINNYVLSVARSLKDNGYRNATVQTVLNDSFIIVKSDPGSRTTIASLDVEGLVAIPESVITNAIELRPGDPWVRKQLQESRRRLLLLGLFSRVELQPADGDLDSPNEALLIRVVERALTTLEVGGGVNSELGVHAFGEAVDKSIFLDGSSLGIRLDLFLDQQDGSVNQGVAGLRYTQPSFLGSPYQLTQDARFQKTDLTTLEFDLERYILDSALYRRITDDLTVNFSYGLSQDNITNVPEDVQLSHLDSGIVNLSIIGSSIRFDKRDSPVLPNRGYSLSFDPRFTSRGIGSDANYYSISSRGAILYPFFATPFSIAQNVRIASAWTFDGTTEVPITQRYYLGGRQSVRGFRENTLGPKGSDGNVIGGDLLVQSNFELRYRLQETVATHVFFDAGNVFLGHESFAFSELRTSVGVGARYLSPIGPIGFDIGHPLDEQPGEPSVRLHFNIGATF